MKIVRQARETAQKELVVSNIQLTVYNTPQKKNKQKNHSKQDEQIENSYMTLSVF